MRNKKERKIRVRSIRRDTPDVRKLGAALLDLAQIEADAMAERERRKMSARKRAPKGGTPPEAA